jgi:hypothetical protein
MTDLDTIEKRAKAATEGLRVSRGGVTLWTRADGEFVDHSREDVLALIKRIRELEAEVQEYQAALDSLGD